MQKIGEAIKIRDMLMESHLRLSAGIREKTKYWEGEGPKSLAITIAETHEDVAKCLLAIKSRIQPNCKHPKKMRDKCAGIEYCMNCNMDIED